MSVLASAFSGRFWTLGSGRFTKLISSVFSDGFGRRSMFLGWIRNSRGDPFEQ
uniref:Uncharacterized protein n=1 Tax=Glycine max TaxID=3847 RepID=C6TCQ3_SOYBN|nr:unknown [Glycine max]